MSQTKQPARVAYLSASSGGGHDGVARALLGLGRAIFGDEVEQQVVDLYGGGGMLARLPIASRLRYHSGLLWKLFLAATDSMAVSRLIGRVMRPLAVRRLRACLPQAPDLLVAVHFGAAQMLDHLAASYPIRPRTAIVVTDYEPHWAWIARADLIVVPSERARGRALEAGYRPDQILMTELLPCVVGEPKAVEPTTRLRVLAAAGADGTSVRPLRRILRLLDESEAGGRIEVEVVCGSNEALQRSLAGETWRRLQVRASGFVRDLPARMASADVALLRASPQTITEAVAAGTPVVAFDWHSHEAPNATLLTRLGCGLSAPRPDLAAAALTRLASDADELARWRLATRAVADRAQPRAIVEHLLGGQVAA